MYSNQLRCSSYEDTDLFKVTFPHLEDSEVVVGLSMVVVGGQGEAETLVRKIHVTNALKQPVSSVQSGLWKTGKFILIET